MATRIARANKQERIGRQYLVLRAEAAQLEARKKQLNKDMKDYIQNNGVTIDGGHREFRFSEPVEVDGKRFLGLKNTRKNSQTIDLEQVEMLLAKRDIPRGEVFKQVVVEEFDQDAFFVLNQEDKISEEDVDSVFVDNITWALEVIEDK